jgi:Domain of unknown function (DUF4372)
MNFGKYVFAQIMGLVSSTSFQTIVNRHSGDYKVKEFTCWKQYLCVAFAQLTRRESISDTVLCLKANANKLYHADIGEVVAVSTITRANESRSFKSMKTWLCSLFRRRSNYIYAMMTWK